MHDAMEALADELADEARRELAGLPGAARIVVPFLEDVGDFDDEVTLVAEVRPAPDFGSPEEVVIADVGQPNGPGRQLVGRLDALCFRDSGRRLPACRGLFGVIE
ncbi:hypothetical protein D3C71_1915860 [compost metagenome]